MKNKKKMEIGILLVLIIAVLGMTVGFAYYAQNLTINGTVTVKGSPWKVHYVADDITETSGSETATSATIGNSDTNFAFTVTLEKPGDFYEATINVINEGSMDALLKKVTMGLSAVDSSSNPVSSSDLAKYLTYTITYNNGTPYTATTDNITGITLAANANHNATHPVKIRVAYTQPASSADLPSTDVTVTVTGQLDYQSAT